MPKIPQAFLDSVFFLYETKDDANRGEKNGGTGFLFQCQDPEGGPTFLYAVSNWHVVSPTLGNAPVARVSRRDGVLELLEDLDWRRHPDGDDLAVASVGLSADALLFGSVPSLITLGSFSKLNSKIPTDQDQNVFGPGNEVFFIGRYADHEGRETNYPLVRFGSIAMEPRERIPHRGLGIDQDSFVVESRSLGGFSGSPVFIYPWCHIDASGRFQMYTSMEVWFVGIVWGHGDQNRRVLDRAYAPTEEPMWVRQNSGLMYVVPSWRLIAQLDDPEERRIRGRQMAEWK